MIAVYVQNLGGTGGIYKPVIMKWGKPEPITANLCFHRSLNGELAHWQDKDFDDSSWKTVRNWKGALPSYSISWYRGRFVLPSHKGWTVPWRLHVESTGNMQIWLNGKLLGRYFAEGPQKDFYFPDGWLNKSGENQLAFVLRPSGDGAVAPRIIAAYVAPAGDYVVQDHTLKVSLK
jgi:hypothetical protein